MAGARPSVPEVDGIRDVPVSRQHFGHGVGCWFRTLAGAWGRFMSGLEFGQLFRRFGQPGYGLCSPGAQLLNGRRHGCLPPKFLAILKPGRKIEALLNSRAGRVTKNLGLKFSSQSGLAKRRVARSKGLTCWSPRGGGPNTDRFASRPLLGLRRTNAGFI